MAKLLYNIGVATVRLSTIVLEAIMGAREYTLPWQPIQQMADFYLLDIIKQPGDRVERSQPIDTEINIAERILLPQLRKELLIYAGYSIACELKHGIDAVHVPMIGGSFMSASAGELPARTAKMFKHALAYFFEISGISPTLYKIYASCFTIGDNPDDDSGYDSERPNRTLIVPHLPECVRLGLKLFNSEEIEWTDMFGGPLWAAACQCWLDLQRANSLPAMRMATDRIFQLQHNSGALLNKNPEFQGRWLEHILNIKYEANNPEELIRYASSYVRQLATYVLGIKYGRGWDTSTYGARTDEGHTPENIIQRISELLEGHGCKIESTPGNIYIYEPTTNHDLSEATIGHISTRAYHNPHKEIRIISIFHGNYSNPKYYKTQEVTVNDPDVVQKIAIPMIQSIVNYLSDQQDTNARRL